ncbi:hypothetical protein PV325_002919 [Microctonus aethiopoides]|uniref:NADH dehydrogenase [ubiquinone] 1 beta subcomplex subunit 5, mitochondrial n=1 Tax=Microctonus aethiopoides TaxID=144406 RepID=A0AA39KLS9_9HYME|nr:hypothetical protein PV325_002919 [Microctonus aethiopoides]KAK0082070.1 hypothetical protein PV326_007363 [Microctonus aethiopoides]KAK0166031.1 hypothetical protein PV328_004488 [Microctonus aethiopoides]
MAAWSGLIRSAGQILLRNKAISPIQPLKNGTIIRLMSEHRTFQITATRWHWDKTKDLFHLYTIVAGVPIGIVILLTNIFVGPATLTPIPEGYEPKHWEYHKHPITRFLARYVFRSDQMEYEKYLHFIWTQQELIKCRELEAKVKSLMSDRLDYQAYYYQPFTNAKYIRKEAQVYQDSKSMYSRP